MLTEADSYKAVCQTARWKFPEHFNMGVDVCDKHAAATPDQTALIVAGASGDSIRYSFAALKELSDKFANVLVGLGLERGDRFAILLSQSVETAIAHSAAWKAGLV